MNLAQANTGEPGVLPPLPLLATRLIVLLLCLVALALLIWTLLLWHRFHPHMPWRDTLGLLRELQGIIDGNSGWKDLSGLLLPHYTAHRVLVPRLLLLLDLNLFAGQSHVFFTLAWASMALLLVLQWISARDYFRDFQAGLVASLALFAICLFSPTHLWNLLNPLNSSWHLSIALSMLAFLLALSPRPTLSAARLSTIYALLALAAFTNFSGVIAWLILPVLFLLHRRRYWGRAGVASVLLVVLYMQGIASDAAMALDIMADLAPSEATRQLEQQALAVLASNSAWLVIQRTTDLLAWPLSQQPGIWVRLPVALSVLGLAGFWWVTLRRWYLRQPAPGFWLEYCLAGATLCLGIATSVQLGRLLPYPDAVHGPSPARFETFIVCYWGYTSALAVSLAGRKIGWRQTGVLAATASIVLTLVLLPGRVVARQLQSAEYAAMVFLVGEQGALKHAPGSMAAAFTSDYALHFDALFKRLGAAYHAEVAQPPSAHSLLPCDNLGLRFTATEPLPPLNQIMAPNRDFQALFASAGGASRPGLRHILVFDGSQLVGRLGPHHHGDFSPWQLAQVRHYDWRGGYLVADSGTRWSTIALETLPGLREYCKVRLPRSPILPHSKHVSTTQQ